MSIVHLFFDQCISVACAIFLVGKTVCPILLKHEEWLLLQVFKYSSIQVSYSYSRSTCRHMDGQIKFENSICVYKFKHGYKGQYIEYIHNHYIAERIKGTSCRKNVSLLFHDVILGGINLKTTRSKAKYNICIRFYTTANYTRQHQYKQIQTFRFPHLYRIILA